jgi:enoyl-CoA hydratase/carnithine racemase
MDDLGTPYLRLERRGPLAWCTIDRPKARNALTPAMYFGVRRAVDLVNADPELCALILTGTGDVFCPGGDMSREHDDPEAGAAVTRFLGPDLLPFDAIRYSRAPVVSAVNGLCQGGGLTIAMLSDVTVASDRATFRGPELLRGVADAYYAQIMPAHIGIALTRDLMFTGRRLDATEAVAAGLISRVVDHDSLAQEAEDVARQILHSGPDARFQFKRILHERYGAVDHMTFNASISGPEAREGMRAFIEKRSPEWVPDAYRDDRRL